MTSLSAYLYKVTMNKPVACWIIGWAKCIVAHLPNLWLGSVKIFSCASWKAWLANNRAKPHSRLCL